MGSIFTITIWLVLAWRAVLARSDFSSSEDTKSHGRPNINRDENSLPHIIIVVIDDLGSHDLGLHGTGIHTPNIDGFVTGKKADGIYLDNYYVLPYCSPTRAALLSGMYPLRTGVHNVIEPKSTAGLPLNVETLPEMLKRATRTRRAGSPLSSVEMNDDGRDKGSGHIPQSEESYQTHAVGKWHVGHSSFLQTPTFRGFDSFFGFYQGGQDYFTHSSLGGVDLHFDRSPRCGNGCSEVVNERGNYSTHVFTREAIKVVETHAKKFDGGSKAPLFLYLAYQAVHCPNEVPNEYTVQYNNRTDWSAKRKSYAGMLTAADEGIGNLTQILKSNGMWENTLLMLTTDNGGPTTVGCTQGSSNYPKRGGKCSLWEGGTTGDALLAGPALERLLARSTTTSPLKTDSSFIAGKKKTTRATKSSSRRFQHLFHVVDWFPTLAEWVGVVPLNETVLDGISQAEALASGDSPARTELFGGYAFWKDHSTHAWWGPSLRHLNWKLVQGASAGPDAKNPLPPGSKDISPPGEKFNNSTNNSTNDYLLFDLDHDPGEENDLSTAYPEILQKMIYRLKLYRKYFVYPQVNDDSNCPFPGLVNTTTVGPAWCVSQSNIMSNIM